MDERNQQQRGNPDRETSQADATDFHSAADIDRGLEVHDYVMGRLDAAARERFEARLAADPALAEDVEAERVFALTMASRSTMTPAATAFEDLRPALEQRPSRVKVTFLARGAVAAALLIALALFVTVPSGDSDPAFETLSSDGEAPLEAALVRLRLQQAVDGAERAGLARRYGFEFVSGSGEDWLVRVPSTLDDAVLAIWQQDPLVASAQREPAPR